jgi:hypothetical protein
MISLVSGFVGGIAAWFVTQFIAAPLADFYAVRNGAAQAFHRYDSALGIEGITDTRNQARIEFGRLASRLVALDETAVAPLRWYLTRRGYDMAAAGAGLTGYSNAFAGNQLGTEPIVHIVKARQGLKLPVDHHDLEIYERQLRLDGVAL